MAVLSVEAIRALFPSMQRTHNGLPVAYLDGPGGTQVPASVADAMRDYLLHHNANTHWAYPTSEETDAMLASARAALGDFLGAAPDEVAFGANMTTLTFHLSRALARAWQPGDEVIVTELDHHANVDPWRQVARDAGLVVRTVPFDVTTGELQWAALEAAFTSRTRLLAIGAASNALGTISDVTAAARLAHASGALCYVDAVHFAAHELVDVRAIDCDILVCSPYKFYGPHVGTAFVRRELLARLDVPKLAPAGNEGGERVETGTLSHEAMVGAGAAVDFLASLAPGATSRRAALAETFAALHARGLVQVTRLWDSLRAIPGVTVYGPPPTRPRTSTLSFVLRGHTSTELARHLVSRGLFASNGDFYAQTVIERLGHADDGLLRIGCSAYTTDEEIERVIAAVQALAA
ncbi:MAG: cysteine desulfurase-like protein [Acidobacteria bacterium]|nr:cysteine desulfurase-like protein [Acidobacteriota bacterium]